jgi:hypothetical protein
MGVKIGIINADTSVKLGTTTIQSGYIGTDLIFGNQIIKILDAYGSAHHAYSLRKLGSVYNGACLRVRRTTASPNPVTTTTADVEFDSNGTISFSSPISNKTGIATNATTLGQFAQGTVDGLVAQSEIRVVTWYDQSGNGKNPTNATVAQQPRLVRLESGVATLETSGGKAAVRFIRTSSTRLRIADNTANINNLSSYFVGAYAGFSTNVQNVYSLSTTNRWYLPASTSGTIYAGYFNDAFAIILNSMTTDRKLYELIAPVPISPLFVAAYSNGSGVGQVTLQSGPISNIDIGAAAGLNPYDGFIQEIITYQSNANRLQKERNINSYWHIYGL